MIEVDKERLGYEEYREEIGLELGLVNIYAYHSTAAIIHGYPRILIITII